MKASAIASRGTKRDFVDLHVCAREGPDGEDRRRVLEVATLKSKAGSWRLNGHVRWWFRNIRRAAVRVDLKRQKQ
jgi:hypothetical protein